MTEPAGDGDHDEGQPRRGPLRLLAAHRIPLWSALLLLVVVALPLTWLLAGQRLSALDLGPAVSGADRISVEILLCNRVVDAHDLNPREAELDLQDTLEGEGAERASVRIRRRDCPSGEAP